MRRTAFERSRRRAAAAGFTLIEVLLATVLLAAGLALAFATLRASTATVERGEGLAARSDRMRAVEGFLRRRLAAAQPLAFAMDPGSGQALRFVGERDRMRFVADLPDYLGRGGPHLHDISFTGDGDRDGARLQVAFAMVLAGEVVADPDARPPEPLVRGLREARFRYRGLDAENRFTEWSTQWEAVDQLPLQVSIEIVPEVGAPWPELVVALPQSVTVAGPRRAMPSLDAAAMDARRGAGNE
jgi:general secretion pathway protein J